VQDGGFVKIPKLTPNEIHMAACHGVLRRYEKLNGKRGDRPQKERSSWDNEIEGACCELAVSKWLGVPWSGAGNIRANDVDNYEVKWTRHNGTGGLIVHKYFEDDAKFLLFDGHAPQYNFVGWAYGREAKKDEYLQSWGAYLLPRDKLRVGK
jgi:hypothetical protein